MKRLGLALAFCLSFIALAHAQGGMGPGPGTVHSTGGGGYAGPGDVLTNGMVWGSVSRSYTAAYANGTNPIADLVAVTGGGAVCTMRVATTGFVDLTAYCPGSLTPAAACAAASGGSCKVTKVYDQIGTNHFVQVTLANMPAIIFSAVNGLPALVCAAASSTQLVGGTTLSQAQPWSFQAVWKDAGSATASYMGLGSGSVLFAGGANPTQMGAGTIVTIGTGANSSWHGVTGSMSGAASVGNLDGVESSALNAGSTAIAGNNPRLCSDNLNFYNGNLTEGGLFSVGFNATQRGNMYTNMHGTNGYNGAF